VRVTTCFAIRNLCRTSYLIVVDYRGISRCAIDWWGVKGSGGFIPALKREAFSSILRNPRGCVSETDALELLCYGRNHRGNPLRGRSGDSMSDTYELKANVEGEQFTVDFESEDAATAAKSALNDAGHNAGVYVPVR